MTTPLEKFQKGPTLLERFQADTALKTADIPEGHHTVLMVAADWKAGVPVRYRFGFAVKAGDHFELDAETQTKFTKASTDATLHAVWSW